MSGIHRFQYSFFLSVLLLANPLIITPALATKVIQNTRVFKLELGATRVIYQPGGRGVLLPVVNPQNFPVLVQSQVLNEDRKTQAPFVVTPPLFRLEPNQRNTLRVIGTGNIPSQEKESLYWLCVTGIPPKSGDAWAENDSQNISGRVQVNMAVSTHMCIKLISRPENLSGSVMLAAESLHWIPEGDGVRAENSSPYYINLHSLNVGGREVTQLSYIPPFSTHKFSLKAKPEGTVSWSVITDAGGESRRFTAQM